MRAIVNFVGGWERCWPACRRARRCSGKTPECFDANRDGLREALRAIVDWRRFEGPRDPDEAAAPATVLFD